MSDLQNVVNLIGTARDVCAIDEIKARRLMRAAHVADALKDVTREFARAFPALFGRNAEIGALHPLGILSPDEPLGVFVPIRGRRGLRRGLMRAPALTGRLVVGPGGIRMKGAWVTLEYATAWRETCRWFAGKERLDIDAVTRRPMTDAMQAMRVELQKASARQPFWRRWGL